MFNDNIQEFGGSQSFVVLYRLARNRRAWRATVAQPLNKSFPLIDVIDDEK